MTSAELMRHQMKVTEQSDNRLRKTLMKTLIGQVILPPSPLALCRRFTSQEGNMIQFIQEDDLSCKVQFLNLERGMEIKSFIKSDFSFGIGHT